MWQFIYVKSIYIKFYILLFLSVNYIFNYLKEKREKKNVSCERIYLKDKITSSLLVTYNNHSFASCELFLETRSKWMAVKHVGMEMR